MKGWLIAGVLLIAGAMAWLAALSDDWARAYSFTGPQDDYYNLLVHGFLQGRLSMDVPVDPRLFSPDPAVRRQAAVVQDASLYRGRYYLYFGIVPAALVFLPYRLLTGQDLSGNAACVALVLLGFLLQWRIYSEARRRYFPALSRWLEAGCLLLLAFGAGTPALLTYGAWYEIAIAGGYAFMAAAWLGMFYALHSRSRAAWIGFASAALGFAVGCRPTYILMLPVLAAAAFLARRGVGSADAPRAGRRLAAAAVLPAGGIGLLLAAYNWARFDNPLEFGMRYETGTASSASASFLWPNLKAYYLHWPSLGLHFPYVFPLNLGKAPPGWLGRESIHGQAFTALLALYCLLWAWRRQRTRDPVPRELSLFLLLIAAGFVAMLAGLACFGGVTDRYLVDFQGSLVLALALLGSFCAASFPGQGPPARAGRVGFGALAAATAAFSVLAALQVADHFQQMRPRTYGWLARYGNYPALLLTRIGLEHYGPVHFRVVFPPVTQTVAVPLVATGVPGGTDVLHAILHPPNLVEFQIDGVGNSVHPRSRLIAVESGRPYDVEVDLGSLYPPRGDPFFDRWSEADIDLVKTTARVRFDGEDVIYQKTTFFDAPPDWVFFGENKAGTDPVFAGRIVAPKHNPRRTHATLDPFAGSGVWRLRLGFSDQYPGQGQPILASGTTGHGNLLLVHVLPGGALRFTQDQWGGETTSSPLVPARPGPRCLEVYVSPQAVRWWRRDAGRAESEVDAPAAGVLRVWLDGRVVWTTAISRNLDSYDQVAVGDNPQGYSTALREFRGSLEFLPYRREEMKAFIERNLQETAAGER